MSIPGPKQVIPLSGKKFRLLTLMNGWDTSHDFFQPIRDEWKSKYEEDDSVIMNDTDMTGGSPTIKPGVLKSLKSLNTVSRPSNKTKMSKMSYLNKQSKAKLFAKMQETIYDNNDFRDDILSELREDLTIYDYLYKFVCEPAIPETKPCEPKDSWIYQEETSSMDVEMSGGTNRYRGGVRPRRERKLSPTATRILELARSQALEEWNEIEGWNRSVLNYLPDSMPWRQAMNGDMLTKGFGLLTYPQFAQSQGLQDDGSKETFIQLQVKDPKRHVVFRKFIKQFNKMKIEGYIKKYWLGSVFDESNPIHQTWKQQEYSRKNPILTNQQTDNLKGLHKRLMQQWCQLAYPKHDGDSGPPSELVGWEAHVYQKMWAGNPSDSILFDKFKKEQPNQVSNDNLRKLSTIVQSALGNGYVINNAAPFQKYLGDYKSNPRLFLKNDKTQYNCVMVSVIDPQSQCPKFSGPHKGDPSGTLRVESDDGSSIQIVYQGSGGSPFIEYTLTIQTKKIFTHKLPLQPNNLSYALQISSVIQPMLQVINKAGKDLDTLDTLDDNFVQDIVKIATGKLCGDFGQELFAVEQILLGGLPIVFMSNDRPSAIRFLDMVETLREAQKLPDQKFWGGFLGKTNHLLVADPKTTLGLGTKATKKKKQTKKKKKKKQTKMKKKKKAKQSKKQSKKSSSKKSGSKKSKKK